MSWKQFKKNLEAEAAKYKRPELKNHLENYFVLAAVISAIPDCGEEGEWTRLSPTQIQEQTNSYTKTAEEYKNQPALEEEGKNNGCICGERINGITIKKASCSLHGIKPPASESREEGGCFLGCWRHHKCPPPSDKRVEEPSLVTKWRKNPYGYSWDEIMVVAHIDQLTEKLPAGMKNCTILFKECPLGHGRLTAKNWVDSGCLSCRIDQLKEELKNENEAARFWEGKAVDAEQDADYLKAREEKLVAKLEEIRVYADKGHAHPEMTQIMIMAGEALADVEE